MNHSRFKIVGATDVGQKRATNEDYLLVNEDLGVIVLADGMGGHNAGEVASQMVATTLMDHLSSWLRKSKPNTIKKNLKKAISRFIYAANQQVFHVASVDALKRGMGTTLIVAVQYEGKLTIAHVGDSRAYLFRNDRLTSLTKDHSKVQELIDLGVILNEHAQKSHFKNILTRAVGVQEEVEATFVEVDLKAGDKTVFCSDGLTNMVTDDCIAKILFTDASLANTLRDLIELANHSGGIDNITVVVGAYGV